MKKYGFIELPIIVYDSKQMDITNKSADECDLMEVIKKVNASSIESYSESIPLSDFREDNKVWTDVFMKSGDTFIVNMPFDKFEKLLISHFENL